MKALRIRLGATAVAALSVLAPPAGATDGASEEDLRERLDVLTEEVRRLREAVAIPATEEERIEQHGLAPAASRVYGKSGLSIGGYGEFHFAAPLGDADAPRTGDFYRFITYFGYKFSDRIVMNTEIEYEHVHELGVEFGYVDFLLRPGVNVRTGNLLVPFGFLNRIHEPPFYRGNVRPVAETRLIPTTWHELGVGLHGDVAPGISYEAYLLNGFDARGFDENGIRGGRQKAGEVRFEDAAGVASLDVAPNGAWRLGGSLYVGQADQNRDFDGRSIAATVIVREAHVQARHRGFEGRALWAAVGIDDADAISNELTADAGADVVVPERQQGWYLEATYDVWPWLGRPDRAALLVWARWEDWNLQDEIPRGVSASPDPTKDAHALTVGLEAKPVPDVVVKADVTIQGDESGGETDDPFRLGVGFVF